MTFLIRLLEYTTLGIVTVVLVGAVILLVIFVLNRGLQIFFSALGYEMGDFFGWLLSKMHIRKKDKNAKKVNS
jgi:hypothetical protein